MDGLVRDAEKMSLEDEESRFVRIGPLNDLASHTRFHLTLRTRVPPRTSADQGTADRKGKTAAQATTYHRLLLFRLSSTAAARQELYCMEATCPHLGAPLSHAPFQEAEGRVETEAGRAAEKGNDTGQADASGLDLEAEIRDMEDVTGREGDVGLDGEAGGQGGRTIVCPWHKYDFSLADGTSGTGMKACVYGVEVRGGEVWVETPDLDGDGKGREAVEWEVVELRGVSEEFADPPVRSIPTATANSTITAPASTSTTTSDDPPALPSTLTAAALLILQTPSPAHKLALTRQATTALRTGGFRSIRPTKGDTSAARALFGSGAYERDCVGGVDGQEEEKEAWVPPREGVESVQPEAVKKRGKGGNEKSRILMLHALANIEQWAIDLAWDIIARFGHTTINGERLPVEFFLDFARMAEDEAKHFSLLAKRLRELGSYYGAHSVHASLWESAIETSHSLSSRLAIIHLVAEARGLDVNPLTIEKFKKAGDAESVRVLEIIHGDEVTHVTTGHRWFSWLCQQKGVDPVATFRDEVRDHFRGKLKGPFNDADRAKAGMSREYYEDLEGTGWTVKPRADKANEGDERIHPRLT